MMTAYATIATIKNTQVWPAVTSFNEPEARTRKLQREYSWSSRIRVLILNICRDAVAIILLHCCDKGTMLPLDLDFCQKASVTYYRYMQRVDFMLVI
jgi:hypothetical protein